MRRPTPKLIIFFLVALAAGYAVSFAIMRFLLGVEYRVYGFTMLTIVAVLVAFILVIMFDSPLNLRTFEWPEEWEKPPADEADAANSGTVPGFHFPYEAPSEHWDIDFGDSKQTYEGTDLPVWLLAGWAAFILWAVVYLISGLPGAL